MVMLGQIALYACLLLVGVVPLGAQQVRTGPEARRDTALVKRLMSMVIQANYSAGELFAKLDSVVGTSWKATVRFKLNDSGEPYIPFTLDIEIPEPVNMLARFYMLERPTVDTLRAISCRDIEALPLKGANIIYQTMLGDSAGVKFGTLREVHRGASTALIVDLLIEGPDLTIAQAMKLLEAHGHTDVDVRDDPAVQPRKITGRVLSSGAELQLTLSLPRPERETVAAGDEWATRKYNGFRLRYGDRLHYIWATTKRGLDFSWGVSGYDVQLAVPISMDPCR